MMKFLTNRILDFYNSSKNIRKYILIFLDISLLIISTIIVLWINNGLSKGINLNILKFFFLLSFIAPIYYNFTHQYLILTLIS